MTDFLTPVHVVFVFIVALLIFGPKRIPNLGRDIGRSVIEFRARIADDESVKDGRDLRAQNPSGESARLS